MLTTDALSRVLDSTTAQLYPFEGVQKPAQNGIVATTTAVCDVAGDGRSNSAGFPKRMKVRMILRALHAPGAGERDFPDGTSQI
jgi:hypothetical protein